MINRKNIHPSRHLQIWLLENVEYHCYFSPICHWALVYTKNGKIAIAEKSLEQLIFEGYVRIK
jgi:hypothetical protein